MLTSSGGNGEKKEQWWLPEPPHFLTDLLRVLCSLIMTYGQEPSIVQRGWYNLLKWRAPPFTRLDGIENFFARHNADEFCVNVSELFLFPMIMEMLRSGPITL